MDWILENTGILKIFNQGTSTVYLKIDELTPTKISVAGVYSYDSSNINYKSQTLQLNAWWTMENGILFKKGDSDMEDPVDENQSSKKSNVYRLIPGKYLKLSLQTNDSFQCLTETLLFIDGKPQAVPPFKKDEDRTGRTYDCRGFYRLSGFLYHIHNFPEISYNSYSTMDYEDWNTLSFSKENKLRYNNQFSSWVPNKENPPHCFKENLENFPIETINKNFMECSFLIED